ncbi:ATP-dependent nuclease [Brevibacillus centrosporus]|uniref:Predicted ATP-dependent endonuclease of the OLD family, contains P-loop ATPase and TOPRIM domains n=1 Tax=Brevibacillus centrosporus TaxID=54910 RepID=A0A1I3L5H3_9BACL|nr:AAA family ATPase [Brevibacillus centrosporus]SFI79806.1 Predicted ATP-dependent endonuclease of the OLD family, contains P-loop ATPase and TOPRIM domains [Brevibacillus centrosporus]
MQITNIKIRNFRSFGDKEISISLSNITTFVGSNSTGKTALIQALQKMFGISQNERLLVRSDFHVPPSVNPQNLQEMLLTIEVKIEFPELLNPISNESKTSVPPFFNQLVIKSPGSTPYIRMRLSGKWTPSNTPDGEIEQKLHFVIIPEEDSEETDDAFVVVSPHQRSVIQMLYVPAVREPLSQLKNASGTILWRILSNIKWPEDIDQQLKIKMEPVNALFSAIPGVEEIKGIVREEWKKYHRDFRYQDASLEFNSTTLSTVLKKIEVQFSPTQEEGSYSIDKLGDGLRSLFYISLVSSLLEVEKQITSQRSAALTILAVEEPENHMSPHLLGRVMDNLNKISSRENAQVILSSHSPSIIKRVQPEEIFHFRIDETNGSSLVNKITLPDRQSEAFTYIKEAVLAYPELYFSKLVILGEGDTEEIVLPKLLKVNGIYADDEGISIVPLGGRYVNHMWKLLNQLSIPHITLLDLDRERDGGGWGRIKYALKQLLANQREREQLLTVYRNKSPYLYKDEEIDEFHKRPLDPQKVNQIDNLWIPRLKGKEYNVFFSTPLDLDFSMMEAFPDAYKNTVPLGPRFPDKINEPEEYDAKIKKGIQATLKSEKSTGYTYTENQHELMVWYNTLFLGRGKPSTHIEALLNISDDELKTHCPQSLKDLVERVRLLLNLKEEQ